MSLQQWQVYHCYHGQAQDLGVVSEDWLDLWSGRLFDHGWAIDVGPWPSYYRITHSGNPLEWWECYPVGASNE